MLASITPLGERGRHRRWAVTAGWYLAGSALGGATIGAAMGAAGSIVPESIRPAGAVLTWLAFALLALAAAIELRLVPLGLPSLRRQVNENWLNMYRGWVVGVGFGFQLGLAVVTIITSPAIHAMLAIAFLTHSPAAGLLVGVAFGVARTLPLLTTMRVTSPDRLVRLHTMFLAASRPANGVVAAVLVTSAVVAAVASGFA